MQALVTLNDPVYFDAARSLGIQANEMRGTDEDRVIFIFKRCVNRAPTHKEMLRLLELYRDEREHARTNTALMDYLSPDVSPEHRPSVAAWSIVSNVILNLDETLTKE